MDLIVLADKYSIYKFKDVHSLPEWVYLSDFYSITKTKDELSVVAVQHDLNSEDFASSKNWRILKVVGPLDLSLVGIISDIAAIMKDEKISIFTISTYDTDYVMVKDNDLKAAIGALRDKGYMVSTESRN